MTRVCPSLFIVPGIVLLCLLAHGGAIGNSFIGLDDEKYLLENTLVRDGLTVAGVRWAFTSFHAANWHPLTWLSHMIDVELFGMAPGLHHLVNVAFHAVNASLLFLFLFRAAGKPWQAAFAASLFAVHPLHVESVAWAAERKDVLSAFFFFLALLAYLHYAVRPGVRRYMILVLLFVLGLLSKPMVVTLPFVLLLLDFWPLGRYAPGQHLPENRRANVPAKVVRLLVEKIPLMILSAASSAVTLAAQIGAGTVTRLEGLPFSARLANALVSYGAYLRKTLWPAGLAVFYPHPGGSIPAWQALLSGAFLAVVSALFLRLWRRAPHLPAGWFFYLVTLLPVIGLVQVGGQAMADRYTYIPLVGIFIALAYGIPHLLRGCELPGWALPLAAASVLLPLTAAAAIQTGYWRNSLTLFRHTLSVTERNWLALDHMGWSLHKEGKLAEAIRLYRESIAIHPGNPTARNHLGIALAQAGRIEEGIREIREAVRLAPDYATAHNNLGVALLRAGAAAEGKWHLEQAARIGGGLVSRGSAGGKELASPGGFEPPSPP